MTVVEPWICDGGGGHLLRRKAHFEVILCPFAIIYRFVTVVLLEFSVGYS